MDREGTQGAAGADVFSRSPATLSPRVFSHRTNYRRFAETPSSLRNSHHPKTVTLRRKSHLFLINIAISHCLPALASNLADFTLATRIVAYLRVTVDSRGDSSCAFRRRRRSSAGAMSQTSFGESDTLSLTTGTQARGRALVVHNGIPLARDWQQPLATRRYRLESLSGTDATQDILDTLP